MSFDEWKYTEARVPFNERYNLVIERNFKKEKELFKKVVVNSGVTNGEYAVIHSTGSFSHFNWNTWDKIPTDLRLIEVHSVDDYTLFDWIGVIEGARELFLVDS